MVFQEFNSSHPLHPEIGNFKAAKKINVVYCILKDGEIIYVGATTDPVARKAQHVCRFGKSVTMAFLEIVENKSDLLIREKYWIEKYDKMFNLVNIEHTKRDKRYKK